jgi:hypothetical protein
MFHVIDMPCEVDLSNAIVEKFLASPTPLEVPRRQP